VAPFNQLAQEIAWESQPDPFEVTDVPEAIRGPSAVQALLKISDLWELREKTIATARKAYPLVILRVDREKATRNAGPGPSDGISILTGIFKALKHLYPRSSPTLVQLRMKNPMFEGEAPLPHDEGGQPAMLSVRPAGNLWDSRRGGA